MKIIWKFLFLIVLGILIFSCVSYAEGERISNKIYVKMIADEQEKYKDGEYFAGNNGTGNNLAESSPTKVCKTNGSYCGNDVSNCGTYYYDGYARCWQCWAFACQVGYDIFGIDPFSSWNKHRDANSIKPGDIVRYPSGVGGCHSVFVTDVDGDTVRYADSNASGPCRIKWENSKTKNEFQTLLNSGTNNNTVAVYHAPNSDVTAGVLSDKAMPICTNKEVYDISSDGFRLEFDAWDDKKIAKLEVKVWCPSVQTSDQENLKIYECDLSNGHKSVPISFNDIEWDLNGEKARGVIKHLRVQIYIEDHVGKFKKYEDTVDGLNLYPINTVDTGTYQFEKGKDSNVYAEPYPVVNGKSTATSVSLNEFSVLGSYKNYFGHEMYKTDSGWIYADSVERKSDFSTWLASIGEWLNKSVFCIFGTNVYAADMPDTVGISIDTQEIESGIQDDPNLFTIRYDANGGTGVPSAQKKLLGRDVSLSRMVPTRSGYLFQGWSVFQHATSATYQPGDVFSVDANVTLYAVWKQDTGVDINATNFPDEAFRGYIKQYDRNSNDYLSADEIESVYSIDVNHRNIQSLEGVEYFVNLEELNFEHNALTELDITNNIALKKLYCSYNPLTELNLSCNTELIYLDFGYNALTKLDLSKNTKLNSLGYTNYQEAHIPAEYSNQKTVYMLGTGFEGIDFGEGVYDPQAGTVTFDGLRTSFSYEYSFSKISEMHVVVYPGSSPDTGILINEENFPDEVFREYVADNFDKDNSSSISFAEWVNVESINVAYCGIQSLKGIEFFTELTTLNCSNNALTELDVTNNTALTNLDCSNNALTELNVINNTALTYLSCYGQDVYLPMTYENGITSYAIGAGLEDVDFGFGEYDAQTGILQFKGAIAGFDYEYSTGYNDKVMNVHVEAEALPQIDIAINEENFPDKAFREEVISYDWNEDGVLSIEEWIDIGYLYIEEHEIRSLKGIEFFTALTTLDCRDNELTELDLSGNPLLTDLECGNNALMKLDLSGNTELEEIECGEQIVFLPARIEDGKTYYDIGAGFEDADFGTGKYDAQTGLLTFDSVTVSFSYDYPVGFDDEKMTVRIYGEATPKDGVAIDAAHFPDRIFRMYVREVLDTDNSGGLSMDEIAAVTEIDVSHTRSEDTWTYERPSISALTGVELFNNLEKLNCEGNCLKELDVSKNTALKELICSRCELTHLDVRHNTALEKLCCVGTDGWFGSYSLSDIDLSKNTALKYLDCSLNWDLTVLDMNNNAELEYLNCADNNLSVLNVDNNTKLEYLNCSNNALDELDVSRNISLKHLECGNIWGGSNHLDKLDMSSNTHLEYLDCCDIGLTTLNVSDNSLLIYLACGNNELTALDVHGNTVLEYLICDNNRLTVLDVSDNPVLTELQCGYNRLSVLDIHGNTALKHLSCPRNALSALNVRSNVELEYLDCADNELSALDLGSLTKLEEYYISDQRIFLTGTFDDGKTYIAIGEGYDSADFGEGIYDAQTGILSFDGEVSAFEYAYPTGFGDLELWVSAYAQIGHDGDVPIDAEHFPDKAFRMYVFESVDTNHNGSLSMDEIAAVKELDVSWSFVHVYDLTGIDLFNELESLDCSNNSLTALDLSGNPALKKLNCAYNALSMLNISGNSALMELNCSDNLLAELDLRENTELIYLDCSNNNLIELDVRSNTGLKDLHCFFNNLTKLDVSSNPRLEYLNCEENALTSLDVSKNTTLDFLSCSSNALTLLDVSGCTSLSWLECSYNSLSVLNVSSCTDMEYLSCSSQLVSKDVFDDGTAIGFTLEKGLRMSELSGAAYDSNTGKVSLQRPMKKVIYECKTGFGEETMHVEVALDYSGIEADFTLPKQLKVIGEEAFAGAPIRILQIPDGVTTIDAKAFADCANLFLVFVPDSVTSIAADAFDRCNQVTIVCAEGSGAEAYAIVRHIPYVTR